MSFKNCPNNHDIEQFSTATTLNKEVEEEEEEEKEEN
jgi:hypothetical protein